MVGIILTGHGHFAEGLFSAVQLVAGPQEKLQVVNFVEGDSTAVLQQKLRDAAENLGDGELVFLTDIAGGSPFNQSVLLSNSLAQECRVFSGTNMPFLLQVLFDRQDSLAELESRWLAGEIRVEAFHARKKSHQVQAGGI